MLKHILSNCPVALELNVQVAQQGVGHVLVGEARLPIRILVTLVVKQGGWLKMKKLQVGR